jgi:hypothetical protein
VQVARVGVERGNLLGDGGGNGWVRMAYVRDVIARVEEAAARLVHERRAVTANDEQRIGVGVRDGLRGAKVASALGEELRLVEAV